MIHNKHQQTTKKEILMINSAIGTILVLYPSLRLLVAAAEQELVPTDLPFVVPFADNELLWVGT